MKHIIKTEYADENTVTIAAVAVDVPDVIWLQVADPNDEGDAADREEWSYTHDEPVMESDVPYVPLARAEAAEARVTELEAQLAANGGEWRPVTEKPAHGQEVRVFAILNGVYWDDDGIFDVYQVPDEITIKGWRPAESPQE